MLTFLGRGGGATFIQGNMSIPDSRVRKSSKKWSCNVCLIGKSMDLSGIRLAVCLETIFFCNIYFFVLVFKM